jgi:hypothetical protein
MRKWINLVEASPVKLSEPFVKAVHNYIDEHLSDWTEDFQDPAILQTALEKVMSQISEGIYGNEIEIYRAELRPADQIINGAYGSLGSCWSWDANGAGVCNHDNAYDSHGQDLEEVVFTASSPLDQIDWVQTLAKNLILKNEREISLKDNSVVRVETVYSKTHSPQSFTIGVDSSGDF